MYKIIIFIVNSFEGYIQKYDPDLLSRLTGIRLVAIVNKKFSKIIFKVSKNIFSKIYEVEEIKNGIYHTILNEDQVEKIVLEEISKLLNCKELLIVTHNESCVLLAAKIREKFGLSGMASFEASTMTNKIMMKSKLSASTVKMPKHINLKLLNLESSRQFYQYLKSELGSCFIIKPICGGGSFGVQRIMNFNLMNVFLQKNRGKLLDFYAEEYIDGDLYHCDSIVKNSKIILTMTSKYNFPMMEFLNGKNVGSYSCIACKNLIAKLEKFNAEILAGLGVTEGIYHTEIFVEKSTGELIFLESAARAPGGYIIPMYDMANNINLLNLDLKLKLGLPYNLSISKRQLFCFWAFFPPIFGVVKKIHQPNTKANLTIRWLTKIGDTLTAPRSFKDRVGEIMVWSDNYEDLMSDLKYINNNKFIEVER